VKSPGDGPGRLFCALPFPPSPCPRYFYGMTRGTAVATFTIRVLLFGSYAEQLGFEALELTLQSPATIGDALDRIRSLPGGERVPSRPLCALNLTQARLDADLKAGDELALLPPLAGG
jgi:sulfur-carrier protein